MELRKHYYVANIGDQYQRLNWKDFTGDPNARDAVEHYLEIWEGAKLNGLGLEFSSPTQGVGKTFAATHLAKELIKRGEQVFFLDFMSFVNLLQLDETERNSQSRRLRDTTVLILDDVRPAISVAQNRYFAVQFEELIRYRTNFNYVTIMTTNLTPEELHEEYPRTYSLLEAKQVRVEMTGEDARGEIGWKNLELARNNEVEPIT